MNELSTLLTQATLNRAKYNSRLITQKSSAWQSAQVRGYDSSTARYIIETTDGNIIHAKSITNGAIEIGQQVTLSTKKSTPIIDAMPR